MPIPHFVTPIRYHSRCRRFGSICRRSCCRWRSIGRDRRLKCTKSSDDLHNNRPHLRAMGPLRFTYVPLAGYPASLGLTPFLLTSLRPSVPSSLILSSILHPHPSLPHPYSLYHPLPPSSLTPFLHPPSFLPSSSLTPTLFLPLASPPPSLLTSSLLPPPNFLPSISLTPTFLRPPSLPSFLSPSLPTSFPPLAPSIRPSLRPSVLPSLTPTLSVLPPSSFLPYSYLPPPSLPLWLSPPFPRSILPSSSLSPIASSSLHPSLSSSFPASLPPSIPRPPPPLLPPSFLLPSSLPAPLLLPSSALPPFLPLSLPFGNVEP